MNLFLCLVPMVAFFGKSSAVNDNFWAKADRFVQYQSCPDERNQITPCDGKVFIVAHHKSCERLMISRGCGVAVVWEAEEGGVVTNEGKRFFYCKMILLRNNLRAPSKKLNVRHNVDKILFFKVKSGSGQSPSPREAFLTSPFSTEILFSHSKAAKFSTGSYYKSPLWRARDILGAETVTVSMFGNLDKQGVDECNITFANSRGEDGKWFNKDLVQESYPFKPENIRSRSYADFSMEQDYRPNDNLRRQFNTMWYAGCPNDGGWMTVLALADPCPWAKPANAAVPKFFCTADAKLTDTSGYEPNYNTKGRFMSDFEIYGKLANPVSVIYAGDQDI